MSVKSMVNQTTTFTYISFEIIPFSNDIKFLVVYGVSPHIIKNSARTGNCWKIPLI